MVVILVYSVVASRSVESVLRDVVSSPSPIPSASPTPQPSVFGATIASDSAQVVTEVIDGDTIRLATGETLRYIGIDTPETKHPSVSKECFGEEASRRNEELVLGKTVMLEKDVSETDRYGRLLRYVWLDGEMVNMQLVKEGYANASAYPPDIKYQVLLEQAEIDARTNSRGLWSICPTQ